ncbi:hypothetical protein PENTCL1PPCAC_182, partial [Pristionchus entomophagus]
SPCSRAGNRSAVHRQGSPFMCLVDKQYWLLHKRRKTDGAAEAILRSNLRFLQQGRHSDRRWRRLSIPSLHRCEPEVSDFPP